jgi:hypothetical protein
MPTFSGTFDDESDGAYGLGHLGSEEFLVFFYFLLSYFPYARMEVHFGQPSSLNSS